MTKETTFSCLCKYCGKIVPCDSAGSFAFHNTNEGTKCYGSYQPAMPLLVSWWVQQQMQKQKNRQTADYVIADVSAPESVERDPWEMCKGGPKPRADCIACGDLIYMAATDRSGQKPPQSFEHWRDEYERFGIPWAKDRMESFVRLSHASILDPDWKPRPVISTTPILPKTSVFSGFAIVMTMVTVLFATLAAVLWIPLLTIPAMVAGYFAVGDVAGSVAIRRRYRK